MNTQEKFVITISREVGSGGRTIAEKLAARLGVRYSDKRLVEQLVRHFGLSISEIEKIKGSKKNWLADILAKVSPVPNSGAFIGFEQRYGEDWDHKVDSASIFRAESEIIREMAEEASCVIAGRLSFYVLRDVPNKLNVFVHASRAHRIERVCRKQNLTAESAAIVIDDIDKSRENYVQQYAGVSRYDLRNYDLVLNRDNLTDDEAVELIIKYIEASA